MATLTKNTTKKEEIIQKIKSGKVIYLKVNFQTFEAVLEITDNNYNVIETFECSFTNNTDFNHSKLQELRLKMLQKAGEYTNKGYFAIINPFNN